MLPENNGPSFVDMMTLYAGVLLVWWLAVNYFGAL